MGLILDSSVVIAAERRGDTVAAMLKQIVAATSDQRAVLSAVGLTELAHGIYRAQTAEAKLIHHPPVTSNLARSPNLFHDCSKSLLAL
jgi:predicted nucleic acid-binding protein